MKGAIARSRLSTFWGVGMGDSKPGLRLLDVPRCDAGAPAPVVVADEERLLFGYYLQAHAGGRPFETCAIVVADSYRALKFGYPNDEVLSGHRYAPLGLAAYNSYEVLDSEWIAEMAAVNRVHPSHSDKLFAADRHFVFVFHDSVLEFVASDEPQVKCLRGQLPGLLLAEVGGQATSE